VINGFLEKSSIVSESVEKCRWWATLIEKSAIVYKIFKRAQKSLSLSEQDFAKVIIFK
jgi:hypothetical protein